MSQAMHPPANEDSDTRFEYIGPTDESAERMETEGDRIQEERAQRILDDEFGTPLSADERDFARRRMPIGEAGPKVSK